MKYMAALKLVKQRQMLFLRFTFYPEVNILLQNDVDKLDLLLKLFYY